MANTEREGSRHLTQAQVEKLLPEPMRRDVYDATVPGLVLRISPSGSKSWSFTYRVRGQAKRLTLGSFPGVNLKLARDRAREARAVLQRGSDPVQEKRDAERHAAANGFDACVTDFVERYAKANQRQWKETKRILERLAVPEFGSRPVMEIRRRDVVDLLDAVYARAPYASNQLRAHLSKMFNWLVEREVLVISPLVGARPRKLAPPVRRALSDEELAALWTAAGEAGAPYGPCLKFMLLTGLRKSNASWLRWEQVAGDWASYTAEEMKGTRPFRCPLSPPAKAIIEAQPKLKTGDGVSPYVFTSGGSHGLTNWSDVKVRVEARMEELLERKVDRWRLHDLRTTLTTGLARLGFSLEVRDRVTDHKTKGVTAEVYTAHSFDEEAQKAVTAWADHVARLTA